MNQLQELLVKAKNQAKAQAKAQAQEALIADLRSMRLADRCYKCPLFILWADRITAYLDKLSQNDTDTDTNNRSTKEKE